MAKRDYKVALIEKLDYVGGWIFRKEAIVVREFGIEQEFVWRTLTAFRSHRLPEGHVTQMRAANAFGIAPVIVSGTTIVNNGTDTGVKPGRVLCPGRDIYTIRTPAAQ